MPIFHSSTRCYVNAKDENTAIGKDACIDNKSDVESPLRDSVIPPCADAGSNNVEFDELIFAGMLRRSI